MTVCDDIENVATDMRPGRRAPMSGRDATMRFIAKRNLWDVVAIQCGLSAVAVRRWKRVPSHRVLQVERAIGRSRRLIRPDIYRTG
jgi:hypothetical protein